MKNSLNKKIEWCRVASRGRNHAILMIDAVGVVGQKDYTRRIYSFPYKVDYYRQFDGSRWKVSNTWCLTLLSY